jgi:hypothetical protein
MVRPSRVYCVVGDIDNSAVASLSQTKSSTLSNLPQVNEGSGELEPPDSLIKSAGKPIGSITVRVGN